MVPHPQGLPTVLDDEGRFGENIQMVHWTGDSATTFGNVGETMADWMLYLFFGLGGFVGLLILNGVRIWWTLVRPRQPKLHADWAADCNLQPVLYSTIR